MIKTFEGFLHKKRDRKVKYFTIEIIDSDELVKKIKKKNKAKV
jgi:hypothetical protein